MKKRLVLILALSTITLSGCLPEIKPDIQETIPPTTVEELNISIGENKATESSESNKIEENKPEVTNSENKQITVEESIAKKIEEDYSTEAIVDTTELEVNDTEFIDSIATSLGEKADNNILEKELGINSSQYEHMIYCVGANNTEVAILKIEDEVTRGNINQLLVNYMETRSTATENYITKGLVDSKEDMLFMYIKGYNTMSEEEFNSLEDSEEEDNTEYYDNASIEEDLRYTMDYMKDNS